MKVSELIVFLQQFDQDKDIVVWYDKWDKQEPDFELFKEDDRSFYAHLAI